MEFIGLAGGGAGGGEGKANSTIPLLRSRPLLEFFTAETTINPCVFARRLTDGGKVESPSVVRNRTCERSLMMHRRAPLLACIDHVKVRKRFLASSCRNETCHQVSFFISIPAAVDLMWRAPQTVTVEASGGKKYTHQQVHCNGRARISD